MAFKGDWTILRMVRSFSGYSHEAWLALLCVELLSVSEYRGGGGGGRGRGATAFTLSMAIGLATE